MTQSDLLHLVVQRNELADALRGDLRSRAISVQGRSLPRTSPKDAIVFWRGDSTRPCIIAIDDNDRDELFNWTTTFHRDLSPLTSWCHVISTKELERLARTTRLEANLFGGEAAWAGAAIAEAMILSRRSYETISLPACLATETFAIARTAALYGGRSIYSDAPTRLSQVRERLKKSSERPRAMPHVAISVLLRLLPGAPPVATWIQDVLVRACLILQNSSDKSPVSEAIFSDIIPRIPQLSILVGLDDISAEQRVKLLRDMPTWIANSKHEDEREILFFTAGYIISKIGGAERDLRLAESFGNGYPAVLTWAAIIGGLGATTYWSDAFGGIGRLVARELSRSLDLVDPPGADISADEFLVISGLDSGATKFRTALRQVATISLRAGVVVQLSILDEDRQGRPEEVLKSAPTNVNVARERQEARHLETLAEQLFPYISNLLRRAGFEPQQGRSSRKSKSPQLPLK